jgi:thioredoxin-related protein
VIERRHLLALGAGAAAGLLAGPAGAGEVTAPVMTDDGLYTQAWFLQSFLDLGEDLAEAAANGKRFAIIWEQKGCPYCQETHLVNFADPEIQSFLRDNFEVLQLNLFGAREVTDFDGEALEERKLARKYGIAFTPTIQFFPEDPEQIGGRAGKEIEVVRMPGYLQPPHFLAMFRFVRERAYEDTNFRSYLKAKAQ